MLREEIEAYREPQSRGVSNIRNPGDHSCDNSPLFTATYLDVLKNNCDPAYEAELEWFRAFMKRHEIEPGLYSQYPVDLGGSSNYTAHDELHVAAVDLGLAQDIYAYAKKHWWYWNSVEPGKFQWNLWFARHPGFTSFIKLAAKKWLMPWDYLWFVLPYIADCFVGPEDTNGRCMLLLRSRVVPKHHYFIRLFVWLWKKRMNRIYNGLGAKGMRSVYFGSEHPIALYTRL